MLPSRTFGQISPAEEWARSLAVSERSLSPSSPLDRVLPTSSPCLCLPKVTALPQVQNLEEEVGEGGGQFVGCVAFGFCFDLL